jgi:hypothetical protein
MCIAFQANLQRIGYANDGSSQGQQSSPDGHVLIQSICDTCGRTTGGHASVTSAQRSMTCCAEDPGLVRTHASVLGEAARSRDSPIWISSDPTRSIDDPKRPKHAALGGGHDNTHAKYREADATGPAAGLHGISSVDLFKGGEAERAAEMLKAAAAVKQERESRHDTQSKGRESGPEGNTFAGQVETRAEPLMDVTLFMARERLKELEKEDMREERPAREVMPREEMLRHEVMSLRRRCAPTLTRALIM